MTNINGGNDIPKDTELRVTPSSHDHKQKAADEIMREMSMQKFKEKLQKLQVSMVEQIDESLTEMLGEVMREVELNEHPQQQKNQLLYDNAKYNNRTKPSKHGDLPEKQFLARESLLTDLFKIKHINTIYNIFIVILIILFLNTAVYDVVVDGKLNLGLSLIYWNFGQINFVLLLWLGMMSSTLALYSCFSYWAHHRSNFVSNSLTQRCWDYSWLLALIVYQSSFGIIPVVQVLQSNMPPASSMIVLMEQVRLIMKSHAFVRSNVPRAMAYKPHSDDNTFTGPCPDFSHFLYYLFVPTLVYKDSYPRTKDIRWRFVAWHLLEVVGVVFYVSFIFQRFLMPMHSNFGRTQQAPEVLVVSVFGSMMPATLTLLCGFFCLLHSWLNAFAEMMRFADRMFYKDWWNANSYAAYYRMWNVVVHDWLYAYIYRDCCLLMKGRFGPTLIVFLVSALVHEYILMFMFRFFYPMLFLAFGGISASLVFLTKDTEKGGNVFMWLCLSTGTGLLTSMYSMEWYARINCPRTIESVVWDFFVPRSWFCNAIGSTEMNEDLAVNQST